MGDPRFMGQGMRRRMGAPMNTLAMAQDDDPSASMTCPGCGRTGGMHLMDSSSGVTGRVTNTYACRDCGDRTKVPGG